MNKNHRNAPRAVRVHHDETVAENLSRLDESEAGEFEVPYRRSLERVGQSRGRLQL